jgi:hypothetical protein
MAAHYMLAPLMAVAFSCGQAEIFELPERAGG